jgi:hypothetical protein
MRFRLLPGLAGLALAAVLACPSVAAAAAVDRVQVGVPGKSSPTRGFSEGLAVELTSPAAYERGCCSDFLSGVWTGPRVAASRGAGEQNASRIDFGVSFARGRRTAAALARDAGWAQYPELAGRARRVRHVVGGRDVGTLRAFAVVDAEEAPGARVQAALAIGLGRRVHAVVLFNLDDPYADSTEEGAITVAGKPASAWNREQAEAALAAARLVGSLPPARVKARRAGAKVAGRVLDAFGHPVAEVPVALQRRTGGGWRRVAKGTASTRGTYSLRAAGGGRYRVVATLAGSSARSRAVAAG